MHQDTVRPCAMPGCTHTAYRRDLCATHYARWRKYRDPSFVKNRIRPRGMTNEEWFWSLVEKGDGCWFWLGAVTEQGYGKFSSQEADGHHTRVAHRFAYELAYGPLPDDLEACHSCDVGYPVGDLTYRRCCRLDHLFAGTRQDNRADCVAKGRQARGDRHRNSVHPELVQRGTTHGMSKMTDDLIRYIRARYAGGGITQAALAEECGVVQTTISCIVRRKAWGHVA